MDSSPKCILSTVSKNDFLEQLQNNKGVFIIKFGAEWCGPCKKIEGLVTELMMQLPESATCAMIDVDENFEIYALFKSKKMINGIPAFLCYKKILYNPDTFYAPYKSATGADVNLVRNFYKESLAN